MSQQGDVGGWAAFGSQTTDSDGVNHGSIVCNASCVSNMATEDRIFRDFHHSQAQIKTVYDIVTLPFAIAGGYQLAAWGVRAGLARIAMSRIANPVSNTLARVVPGNVQPSQLGLTDDVFVTNASELEGLTAEQIAQKLTIPNSASGFKIIEFPTSSVSGIATPINRANPVERQIGIVVLSELAVVGI